jgi:hypothetical protein
MSRLSPATMGGYPSTTFIQDRPGGQAAGWPDGPADDAGQVSWAAGADAACRGQFLACS